MRKTESLKILKEITGEKHLNYFNFYKADEPLNGPIASCGGPIASICVYYDLDLESHRYNLSVNFNSNTFKKMNYIFTQEFAKEVFDAIYFIFIQKECEKYEK